MSMWKLKCCIVKKAKFFIVFYKFRELRHCAIQISKPFDSSSNMLIFYSNKILWKKVSHQIMKIQYLSSYLNLKMQKKIGTIFLSFTGLKMALKSLIKNWMNFMIFKIIFWSKLIKKLNKLIWFRVKSNQKLN